MPLSEGVLQSTVTYNELQSLSELCAERDGALLWPRLPERGAGSFYWSHSSSSGSSGLSPVQGPALCAINSSSFPLPLGNMWYAEIVSLSSVLQFVLKRTCLDSDQIQHTYRIFSKLARLPFVMFVCNMVLGANLGLATGVSVY